jgi:drug/metabolite transporter (DMT)-like permease
VNRESRPTIIAAWWVACLLWSSTFLFIRLGLRDIPPFTFAWMRLAIALAILAPLTFAQGNWRTLTRSDVARVCGTGVLLLGVNYGLVFWGAQFVPSGLVAILLAGTPVLALAFGWMLGSERVDLRKVAALAAGVAGVCIIFGTEARASGRSALAGSVAVFAASACVAFAYVWLKTHGRGLPPIAVTAMQSAAGIVPLACLGLVLEGPPHAASWSPGAWGALIYLAVCASVVAFWLNYWLLARMDASAMLMMGIAEVPIAIALGAIVFAERLPPGTLAGGTCVLAGVTLGLYRRQPHPL